MLTLIRDLCKIRVHQKPLTAQFERPFTCLQDLIHLLDEYKTYSTTSDSSQWTHIMRQ